MNNFPAHLESLGPQTQLIWVILAVLTISIISAAAYTFWRGRTKGDGDNVLLLHKEMGDLTERNRLLRKRLSQEAAAERQKPTEEQITLKKALKTIDLLKLQLDTTKSDLANWKQRSVRAEEIIDQKVNELSAVYKADRDYNQGVSQMFLAHIANIKDITTAHSLLQVPAFTMPQVGSGIIIAFLIVYAYLNKPLTNQIITLLATPRFQIYLALGIVVLGAIIYYLKIWRNKK